MPDGSLVILAASFLIVGALYASVGHAGASGYLAVMALLSVTPSEMRPTALAINVIVAIIAFVQFARAGHFRWALFWPFAAASIPAAFFGGRIHLPAAPLKVSIGVVLLLSALWMAWSSARRTPNASLPREPPVPVALVSGAVVGLIAGLTGTGGGIFLSPVMLMFNWADTKRTAATASLFILVNSLAGLAGLATGGWAPSHSLAWLAGAAAVGGLLGSHLGSRVLNHRALRVLLAVVLAIAGAKLMFT